MTTTYNLGNDIGRVRLRTGDTTIATAVFTDEEITEFLTAEGSVELAVAAVYEAWAGKYATNADSETIGDYTYAAKITSKMLDLARNIRAKVKADTANTPAMDWAEPDLLNVTEDYS